MMQLRYTVKMAQLLKIKAHVPSIWTKGCRFSLIDRECRGILLLRSSFKELLSIGNNSSLLTQL